MIIAFAHATLWIIVFTIAANLCMSLPPRHKWSVTFGLAGFATLAAGMALCAFVQKWVWVVGIPSVLLGMVSLIYVTWFATPCVEKHSALARARIKRMIM